MGVKPFAVIRYVPFLKTIFLLISWLKVLIIRRLVCPPSGHNNLATRLSLNGGLNTYRQLFVCIMVFNFALIY